MFGPNGESKHDFYPSASRFCGFPLPSSGASTGSLMTILRSGLEAQRTVTTLQTRARTQHCIL